MGYKRLREELRRARHEQSMTQEMLASRCGASRVTVARVETGAARDVRVGTIARMCEALGLEVAAVRPDAEAMAETLLLRERENGRRLNRRLAHALLAARLLSVPRPEARDLVARARGVVDRWEREELCSLHYIKRWRTILEGPLPKVAESLVGSQGWTDALFQNTPWGFALDPVEP